MSDPDQLDLDGNRIGEAYKVTITETNRGIQNIDEADEVKTLDRKVCEYRVRGSEWRDAVDAAMHRHLDEAEAMEIAIKVVRA